MVSLLFVQVNLSGSSAAIWNAAMSGPPAEENVHVPARSVPFGRFSPYVLSGLRDSSVAKDGPARRTTGPAFRKLGRLTLGRRITVALSSVLCKAHVPGWPLSYASAVSSTVISREFAFTA